VAAQKSPRLNMSEMREAGAGHVPCKPGRMNPRMFFLFARVSVFAAVCGVLASTRYSLAAIFPRGFFPDAELPLIDGRFVLLTLSCAALGVALVEICSRLFAARKISRLKPRLPRTLPRTSISPKLGT
jgi:hypothetical protein